MKLSTLAILFTIFITISCVFASCNTQRIVHDIDTEAGNTSDTDDYSSIIKVLEDQILELKQNQYISESKRTEEILRLEALIEELKLGGKLPTEDNSYTEGTDTDTDTEESHTEARFIYEVENGSAILTGYTGDDTELTLPSFIDGYAVTEIADDTFISDTLKAIVIPEGVKKIGWFAFKNCSALYTVTIPQSVEEIGYSAFPSRLGGFSVICPSNSFAAKYAASYGISATLI